MPGHKGNKNAVGNKGGRPTLFKSEYAKRIKKFFDIEPLRQEVSESSIEYFANGAIKKENKKWRYMANKMPTLYRFSEEIGVDYTTVYRWAEKGDWEEGDGKDGKEKKPPVEFIEFCNAYKAAKELQKEFLISLGLSGATPSAAFIFTAKNVTDMKDKTETDITSKGKPITKIEYIVPTKPTKINT